MKERKKERKIICFNWKYEIMEEKPLLNREERKWIKEKKQMKERKYI